MPEKYVIGKNAALQEAINHHNAGDYLAAGQMYRDLLEQYPQDPDILHLFGLLRYHLSDHDTAENYLRQALQLSPDNDLYLSNLGTVLNALKQRDEARASYEQALKINPDSADAHNGLGVIHRHYNRFAEAIACYERAIAIRPDFAEALSNLGNVLTLYGRPREGLLSIEKALQINPEMADAWNNYGFSLTVLGRISEAEEKFRKAIQLKKKISHAGRDNFALAHFNLASNLLRSGKYVPGWEEYEWRLHLRKTTPPAHPVIPGHWDGSDISGKRLLLLAEQGMGDFLQFIRFARDLKTRGIYVIAECDKRLLPLMSHVEYIDEIFERGEPAPKHDYSIAIMSLGRVMNIKLEDLVQQEPYLDVQEHVVMWWRKKLERITGLKTGITWYGNPDNPVNHLRSFAVNDLLDVLHRQDIRPVSLQTGPVVSDLIGSQHAEHITDLGIFNMQLANEVDFIDSAAILKNLDLFITSCTVTAHLAGALGVRTWLLLSHVADWRWGMNSKFTPWYPTIRIIRQPEPGDWSGAFNELERELQKESSGKTDGHGTLVSRTAHASVAGTPGFRLVYDHNDAAICSQAENIEVSGMAALGELLRNLPHTPLVISVNAGPGIRTLSLAAAVGEEAIFHVFEQDSRKYRFLNANSALNNHLNIHCYQGIPAPGNTGINVSVEGVKCKIDKNTVEIGHCDLCLVETGNGVFKTIQDWSGFIIRYKPAVLLCNPGPDDTESYLNFFLDLGYRQSTGVFPDLSEGHLYLEYQETL